MTERTYTELPNAILIAVQAVVVEEKMMAAEVNTSPQQVARSFPRVGKIEPASPCSIAAYPTSSTSSFTIAFSVTRTALRRALGDESFDLVDFFVREAQIAGAHNSLGLTRVARARDRSGHCGMVKRPRDRDFSG